jgi:hypothetical protein
MAIAENAKATFHVHRRVLIALNALDDAEKQAVERVISSREVFLETIAEENQIQKISDHAPLFSFSTRIGLLIIYTISGENIEVKDLMGKEAFDYLKNHSAN